MSPQNLSLFWSIPRDGVAVEVAEFFVSNVDVDYISHQEIQCGRALSVAQWAPDLREMLISEVQEIWNFGGDTDCKKGMVEARIGTTLVGMAIVTWHPNARTPYAWGEDMVVCRDEREKGAGRQMMKWIEAELLKKGIRQLFLESGQANQKAHAVFERSGFSTCSVVMMKSLDSEDQ